MHSTEVSNRWGQVWAVGGSRRSGRYCDSYAVVSSSRGVHATSSSASSASRAGRASHLHLEPSAARKGAAVVLVQRNRLHRLHQHLHRLPRAPEPPKSPAPQDDDVERQLANVGVVLPLGGHAVRRLVLKGRPTLLLRTRVARTGCVELRRPSVSKVKDDTAYVLDKRGMY